MFHPPLTSRWKSEGNRKSDEYIYVHPSLNGVWGKMVDLDEFKNLM